MQLNMWCCHVPKRFKNINYDNIGYVVGALENLTYLSS